MGRKQLFEGKTKRTSICIHRDWHNELAAEAARNETSVSQIIAGLVQKHVQKIRQRRLGGSKAPQQSLRDALADL